MGKRVHKENCGCTVCRSKRGDRPQHKPGCNCCICKAIRGEAPSGKDHPRYGKSSWCKDLTKENDERIKDRGKKISKSLKDREFSVEHKKNLSTNHRKVNSKKSNKKRSDNLKKQYENGRKPVVGINYHKENCNCSFCRQKRGDKVKFIHKENCTCFRCRSKRGECRGINSPLCDKEFYEEYGTLRGRYPYSEHFNKIIKKEVLDNYNWQCVVTGISNEEHRQLFGCGLSIHHWNYDKSTDDSYWMVPVCNQINSMANFDKEAWTSFFGGIVQEKINNK